MKISIFIEHAGHELFNKEAEMLFEFYQETINTYDLDIEVYLYSNTSDSNISIQNHRILIPGDEKSGWSSRTFLIMNFIKDNIDCDYVVKTNTSTILNLQALSRFCNTKSFIENPKFYTLWPHYIYSSDETKTYLIGKMYLYPKSFIGDIINSWNDCISPATEFWEGLGWGAPTDDIIMSYVWDKLRFPVDYLQNRYIDLYDESGGLMRASNPQFDIRQCIAYVNRIPTEQTPMPEGYSCTDFRLMVEPSIFSYTIDIIKSVQKYL